MGSDQQQRNQLPPDPPVAQALAALTARVDTLERELAELRNSPGPQPHPIPATTPAPPPPPAYAKSKPSLEDRVGAQLFSRVGVLALLIATALFLKWAIDNQWIGPLGRILAGLIAGSAVILWSERFRRNGFPAFSYSLKAIGSGALYLSLWAAFQLYHLLPASAALAAMIVVTAWNAFMAWSQSSELLAAYALTGALATPLLLSSGGNHEIFLFTYLFILDLATVLLVRLKPWPRLLLGAFPATAAYFIVWYIGWYSAVGHPAAATSIFLALFFLAFVSSSLHSAPEEPHSSIREIFLPLANAAFTALALCFVLEDAGFHDLLPWLAIVLAAVYLGVMRLRQTRTTSAVHLSLAIVFLTIAIPLKASGRWITIGWLAEGTALLWISSLLTAPTALQSELGQSKPEPQLRVAHPLQFHRKGWGIRATREPLSHPIPTPTSALTLRRLALFALTLGLLGLLVQPLWRYPIVQTAFLNARFATALFGIAALALSTLIALHATLREPGSFPNPSWLTIAAASTLALNLTAIFATVNELNALWSYTSGNPDADLQRSLAISAFLMAYGAILLAVGFWQRSAFLRWQALILLAFTAGKAFLYDLRNLSQGYRVFSFLGLGALLMAISFVYQKDWLSLRGQPPALGPEASSHNSHEAASGEAPPIGQNPGANP